MEKARKAYLVFVSMKVLWTVLYLIVALAVLVLPTIFLQWWKIPAFIILGLVTGLSLSALRDRIDSFFYIVLSVVAVLATVVSLWLARVGVAKAGDMITYSRYLSAFLLYAGVSFVSKSVLVKILIRKFELKVVSSQAGTEELRETAV